MTRVAIVGGGIAGLVAARRLSLAGGAVTVFEASDALGGLIQPAQLGALTIDIGAEAFAVRGGVVEAYIRELGLAQDLAEPRTLGSWTYGSRGALPSPAGGMLGIPSGPDAAGLEEVLGADGVAAVASEAALDASIGADARSFAELVRARFGELVLDRLVAPVTRGVYSLDPDDVDHRVLIPGLDSRLAELGSLSAVVTSLRPKATPGALVRGLRGGMHRFVAALVAECEQLGVRFELNTRIQVAEDSPRLAPFDHVIITTESAVREGSATVSSEVVALLVEAPELDARPRGTGVLVSDAIDVEAKALTHVTAKWEWLDEQTAPGQHVLRLSYGPVSSGGPARSLKLDDAQLKAQALTDASRILGVQLSAANLQAFARQEWRMPMPAAKIGRTAELAEYRNRYPIRSTAASERETSASRASYKNGLAMSATRSPQIHLCGAWIDGTGLATVLPSAERAAQRVLDEVSQTTSDR